MAGRFRNYHKPNPQPKFNSQDPVQRGMKKNLYNKQPEDLPPLTMSDEQFSLFSAAETAPAPADIDFDSIPTSSSVPIPQGDL